MARKRIDILIFEKGLTKSRKSAQDLIEDGKVSVSGRKIIKASEKVEEDETVSISEMPKYVSRAGYKLEGAVADFNISVKDKVVLDVGSSTGGFTDFALQNGATKVYAVDVGSDQFDKVLKGDEKVVLMENTDIRKLETLPEKVDLVVIDVSFISLSLVLPEVLRFMKKSAEIVALVKPQFEVGKDKIGKGGIVKSEEDRLNALEKVKTVARDLDLKVEGEVMSKLPGKDGNVEYFLLLKF